MSYYNQGLQSKLNIYFYLFVVVVVPMLNNECCGCGYMGGIKWDDVTGEHSPQLY